MPKAKKSKETSELSDPLKCIELASQLTFKWVTDNGFALLRIEPVTPSLAINKRFSVWLFYDTDKVLNECEANGTTQKIKDKFLSSLKAFNCLEEYVEGVLFFIDSDENAERYVSLKPIEVG